MVPSKKVLVLCKESACIGGVVNYVDSVMKHYSSNSFAVERFTIGRRAGCESKIIYPLVCFYDIGRFFLKLFNKEYALVHINPSLDKVSVLRDGVFLLIARLHCRKVLVFWHGWVHNFQKKMDANSIFQKLFKLTYGNAEATIVLASSFKKKLLEWNFQKKIIVETTTFDESALAGFDPGPKIKQIKGNGKLTLLFLSRLEVAKGIIETIEAFLDLKDIGRELELVIAGDGPAFNLVKERVEQAADERIDMLGYVTGIQKKAILEKSHLLLLPTSYGEGLPVCLLEAMAFAIPIITTPVGGIPDNFTEGENGYYINEVTGKSLAELLRKVIADKDDLARIAANNFAVAGKKFSASIVAQRLEAIYQQVSDQKQAVRV
jgi:glycosyltransferase involved in cell wall biosynthesis